MSRYPKIISRFRPAWDSFFCDPSYKPVKLGSEASWHIIPDLIEPGGIFISGGVGKDISFEMELVQRHVLATYLFDPSPTGVATIAGMGKLPQGVVFQPMGLAGRSGLVNFAAPLVPEEGSFRNVSQNDKIQGFECTTLVDFAMALEIERVALLKLDIEGFEYEVIGNLLQSTIRPIQIAVEFHHFLPGKTRLDTIIIMTKLFRAGYKLVHKFRQDCLFVYNA